MGGSWPNDIDKNGKKDLVWLVLRPMKLTSQSYVQSGEGNKTTDAGEGTLRFLLSRNSISDNASHEWTEWEGLDIVNQAMAISQSLSKIKNIATAASKASGFGGTGHDMLAAGVVRGANENKRLDVALFYKNSQRRKLSFSIQLYAQKSAQKDVMEPIQLLQKYSCAEDQGIFNIEIPYVFKLSVEPSNFIKISNAALEDVQVNYGTLYKDGYPMQADVTLTFKDLDPLYRSSFSEGKNVVRVKSSGKKRGRVVIRDLGGSYED